ncbi:pyrroloquinoline quinone biosynthesis protein PqqB [Zavarzinia compransoris]|uniref:Coenzyme PQQ synthesis protein B n=1 Tax=Zavarzinia compransoris TaxID=1264899 RepID=A0A317DVH9_9PROT|nr:pyrroloquinoline quinone biosynthesis protein PqqB [Zavarzinia compransoris]TDP48673.1 pyrroloquinoline quinone biosynthesis protein B [Zavarzinia compransoris]
MHILLLGTAAGGGFPQWNCRVPNSLKAWQGQAGAPARTQTSIAVSADRKSWTLINASPDLRAQILANPPLWPAEGLRHSPIADVLLTGGEIDFITGLLTMREGHRFTLHGTAETLDTLAANPIFGALPDERVPRNPIALDVPFRVAGGVTVTAFDVAGKIPLYLEGRGSLAGRRGTTIGLEITDGAKRVLFVPGCAAIDEALRARIDGCDLLLFDGTVWRDDELIRLGVSPKTGQRMGHVAMSGPDGAIARLAGLAIGRRVFIHINTTNPTLVAGTQERAEAEAAGWHIPQDGEDIEP